MDNYSIITFYKFVPIANYETLKAPLLEAMQRDEIKGTIILAGEGINGTIAGKPVDMENFTNFIKQFAEFSDIHFKETTNLLNPFDKAKVKIRPEIVSLGVDNINPVNDTGIHVNPDDWNELLENPDVLVIDTRNDYEVELGTFTGAVNPETINFRDFPEYVANNLANKKDKKIAMYCTGGIRCEKSTAYLKKLGFDQVYQLDGGILNYLATVPAEQSLWQGNCFVFDNRVALDTNLNSIEDSIDKEWKNKKRQEKIG